MKLLKIGWRFGLLILIVTIIQFLLLKVILQYGFTSDDWWILLDYKLFGRAESFLDKYLLALQLKGLHHTYQIMYIGILESLFKGNYSAYQITNIIFKILATISLYPLILSVFKRRSLAFLTTLLYGISYSSSGALLFVITGSDYLAIFFMNIFLLNYYYYFATRSKLLLYTATALLFLSFMASPIRMYPLLAFVFLIEVFVWIKSRKLLTSVALLSRLVLLFIPLLIIWRIAPGSIEGGHLNGPSIVYNFLSYGNYQLLLSPFAGLGYTFLTNDYWQPIFGQVTFDSFRDYLFFLLQGPVIIYSVLAIMLGFLITKKPLSFILGIIFTNLVFQIVSYFLITNVRMEVGPNIKYLPDVSIYAIFFGFFVISVAFASLIVWLKNKSNILLLSLFIGPIFSSVFLWGTWMIKGDVLSFTEGIHWYLVTASIGSSLFLGSLMVLTFDRIRLIVYPYLKGVLIGFLFLTILLPIYLISSKEINTKFSYLLSIGYGASDQEEMKNKLLSNIKDPLDQKPRLFYFETKNQTFYPIPLLDGFEERMHFRDWEVINGCVGLIYDKNILEKSVVVKDGIKVFVAHSLCVANYFAAGRQEVLYRPENFYAFKLKDREVIDIKEDTLKELGF